MHRFETLQFLDEGTSHSMYQNGSITGQIYEPTRIKKSRFYQRHHRLHSSQADSPFPPLSCLFSSSAGTGAQLSSSQHVLLPSQCFWRRYCKCKTTKVFGQIHLILPDSINRFLWWSQIKLFIHFSLNTYDKLQKNCFLYYFLNKNCITLR